MFANASFAGEGDCLAAGQSCTTLLTARGESPGVAPRPARRPDGKARRPRISGIFEGGATQPAGMHRRPNAAGLSPRAARSLALLMACLLTSLLVMNAQPLALRSIHVYQRALAPAAARIGLRCRFTPTCSRYAEVVIARDG